MGKRARVGDEAVKKGQPTTPLTLSASAAAFGAAASSAANEGGESDSQGESTGSAVRLRGKRLYQTVRESNHCHFSRSKANLRHALTRLRVALREIPPPVAPAPERLRNSFNSASPIPVLIRRSVLGRSPRASCMSCGIFHPTGKIWGIRDMIQSIKAVSGNCTAAAPGGSGLKSLESGGGQRGGRMPKGGQREG